MSLIEKQLHLAVEEAGKIDSRGPRRSLRPIPSLILPRPVLDIPRSESINPDPRLNKTMSETHLPLLPGLYDKFKARRKQSYAQDLLDVKTRHQLIKKKGLDRVRETLNRTIQPEKERSEAVTVDVSRNESRAPIFPDYEELHETRNLSKDSNPKLSSTEIQKAKRIKSNLTLLKNAQRIGENFSQSIIHAVLYQFQRYVEAMLDEARKMQTLGQLRMLRDQYKRSPLHYAAFLGQLNACEYLLSEGWILAPDLHHRTPLHYAALGNKAAVIELILSKLRSGSLIHLPFVTDDHSINVIIDSGEDEEIGKTLEAMGKYIVISDVTPRFVAPSNGSEASSALDAEDSAGRTALHLAVLSNSYNAVQALCTSGANATLSDSRGNRPIDLSTSPQITKFLLKHLTLKRQNSAKISYDVRDLEILSFTQINEGFIGPTKDTYLISAVRTGDIEALKVLLERGADFLKTNKAEWTAVHVAVRDNKMDVLQFIFEGKLSTYKKPTLPSWTANLWKAMDLRTKKGFSLLHICALYSSQDVLEYICDMYIRRGKLLAIPRELPVSCLRADYRDFHMLLEHQCLKGYTPFLLATKHKRLEIMRLLVKYHCDIYRKTNLLQNALHLATLAQSRETIEYLLYLDSDYNVLKNDSDYRARKPKDLDTTHHSFQHPWDLVKAGNVDRLFALIREGKVSVNASTPVLKNTLLHIALQCKQIFCVRELIKLGANPKLMNVDGNSAYDVLAQTKDARYEQLAKRLLAGESNLAGGEMNIGEIERLYFRRTSIYRPTPKPEAPEPIQVDTELFYILKEIRDVLIYRKLSIADLYDKMDRNKDYSLTKGEFLATIQWLGLQMPEEHMRKVMTNLDPKNLGLISYSRLVAHFQELVKMEKHYETLDEIFEEEKSLQLEGEFYAAENAVQHPRRNSLEFIAVDELIANINENPSNSSKEESDAEPSER